MGCSSFVFGLGSVVVFVCSLFSQSNPLCLPRAARSPSPYRALTRERAKKTRYCVSPHVPLARDISRYLPGSSCAIHWINHYPVDNAIGLRITYPLDSDISGGYTCSSIQLLNNRGQIESLFSGYSKLSTRRTLLGLVMYPALPFFQRCYVVRKKNVKRPLYDHDV